MSEAIYNYKKGLERFLRRIELEDDDKDIILEFINALSIYGTGLAKIVNYAQFSYEILKIKNDLVLGKSIKDLSREEIDRIAR